MAEILAVLAPPAPHRGFTVARSDAGDWIARERRSGLERRFASRKAALHFALVECGGRCACALLAPSPEPWGGRDGR